jgi:hypothetical protein
MYKVEIEAKFAHASIEKKDNFYLKILFPS